MKGNKVNEKDIEIKITKRKKWWGYDHVEIIYKNVKYRVRFYNDRVL